MKKEQIAFNLIVALILIALMFSVYFFIISKNPSIPKITTSSCESAGGNWNDCSNKCYLLYQQVDSTIVCTEECEALCECGGVSGFACPSGYQCILPSGSIRDALGYCEKVSK
ncbi:MAG TPA: hypothetical protein VI815_03440 [Candidatus Nanoarchaeia archaeon]|nr:hypothetical protein [Candidatus Nanoarchaeia archaeon]